MKYGIKALGFCAVAGLAYLAGQSNLVGLDSSAVYAQDGHEGHDYDGQEMDPGMEQMMQAMAPGKNHAYLKRMEGEWEGTVTIWMDPKAEPMVMPGTATREFILGGRYLREEVTSESGFGIFKGLGFIGYNNQDGQYEFAWMENMSTAIMHGTGQFNPDTKVMTTSGSMRDPMSGRMVTRRGHLDLSDPNRHVFKEYANDATGREFLTFKGVFERVEKD